MQGKNNSFFLLANIQPLPVSLRRQQLTTLIIQLNSKFTKTRWRHPQKAFILQLIWLNKNYKASFFSLSDIKFLGMVIIGRLPPPSARNYGPSNKYTHHCCPVTHNNNHQNNPLDFFVTQNHSYFSVWQVKPYAFSWLFASLWNQSWKMISWEKNSNRNLVHLHVPRLASMSQDEFFCLFLWLVLQSVYFTISFIDLYLYFLSVSNFSFIIAQASALVSLKSNSFFVVVYQLQLRCWRWQTQAKWTSRLWHSINKPSYWYKYYLLSKWRWRWDNDDDSTCTSHYVT